MPFEIALLAAREHTLDELRGLAEAIDPPLLVRDDLRPGAITVTEFDDTPVATFGRPRRVERDADVVHCLGEAARLPDGVGYLTEAVVPFDHERGMALAYALERLLGGSALVKGLRP